MPPATERRLSYDKNLLREAEVATQEQFQLRPNRSGFASSSQARLAHPPQPPRSVRFSEKATPSGSGLPFWRTAKGMVLIAVVVVVIIGAIIGAAVGTTVHKSQSVTDSITSSTSPGTNPAGSETANIAKSLIPTTTSSVGQVVGGARPTSSIPASMT